MNTIIPLLTTPTIPGESSLEPLGMVQASGMVTTDFAGDLFAAMKNFIGGSVSNYETLVQKASDRAQRQIEEQAVSAGATAIIGVRFEIATIPLKKGVIVAVHISGTAVAKKQGIVT